MMQSKAVSFLLQIFISHGVREIFTQRVLSTIRSYMQYEIMYHWQVAGRRVEDKQNLIFTQCLKELLIAYFMTIRNISYQAQEDTSHPRQIDHKTNTQIQKQIFLVGRSHSTQNGFEIKGNTEKLICVSPLNVFLVSMQIKPCGIQYLYISCQQLVCLCDGIPYYCTVIGVNSKINVHGSNVKNLRLRNNKQIAKSS